MTGSRRFRRLIESGDYQGAAAVAVDQVRGGANLLDVNMDADLLDSEQAMTTFLNLIATEPEVARIPVMIDSSRWSVLRGGSALRAGQGRGQLDQPQGGRRPVPGPGPADQEHGAGVVVMAFDEQGQADTVERKVADLRPGLRPAHPAGRFRRRGHHLRPQRAGRGDRHRRAQRLRQGVHRRAAADQAALPGRADQRRHLQPVVRVPRQRRAPGGHALGVPVPRGAGRAGHGYRQCRPARGLPGHPGRAAGAGRGCAVRPAPRRHRPAGHVRRDGARHGHQPASVDLSWREGQCGTGSATRWCTASPTSSRPTPRRPGRRRPGRWT